MKQNLVLWGEIATDLKALLAIHLDEYEKKVTIRAFPKSELADELRDQIFNIWSNGGDFVFPEDALIWTIDSEGDFTLPENIKLDRPQLLAKAQKDWLQRVRHAEILKLFQKELNILKLKVDALTAFDQQLWNDTKGLWDKIRRTQKNEKLPWEKIDELKIYINEIFDALKAFKRMSNEQSYEESQALTKLFQKSIDEIKSELIYPDRWKAIFNRLKEIQEDIKNNQLRWKHRKELQSALNETFDTLRNYRKVQDETKQKERVNRLKKTISNLRTTIERDKEDFALQVDRMRHYTRGKMSDEEIEKGLKSVSDKIRSKEKKLKDIMKSMNQLKKKVKESEKKETTETEDTNGDKATTKENEVSKEV